MIFLPPHVTALPTPPRPKRVLFVTDFYQEEVLDGIVDHAGPAGWELIANMRFHGKFPGETEADGILAVAIEDRVREWLEKWKGTPVVNIGAPYPGLEGPSVNTDYMEAARTGARHLMELGHTSFAFYSLTDFTESPAIFAAYQNELAKFNLTVTHANFAAVHGRDAIDVPRAERLRWLADQLLALKKPLAVMSDDDRRSLELIAACNMAGLRVPEDVSILGCENRSVECRMARVPLSSVDMNWRGVGRAAAALLERLMVGHPAETDQLQVPTRGVVARASTATFVTESEGITRSILHIRQHFPESMKMKDLAQMAGMTERSFRTEFKRLVGRSPRSEIQRARLASACSLLRDTDLKLDAIAMESGFGTAQKLCEVFAETLGTTPGGWRQKARQI
ncbi:substrate-binding domain-containing protein [Luteolibacter ambystomatis]|uniref:substrate-binding domain-containing protein n=1 Tax=Luteolibacter ambystomatis TaxID=2824561 RepID=UPI003625DB22